MWLDRYEFKGGFYCASNMYHTSIWIIINLQIRIIVISLEASILYTVMLIPKLITVTQKGVWCFITKARNEQAPGVIYGEHKGSFIEPYDHK